MDFIDLVQSISQKFKLSSFKNTANSLLDLVSQYPGGVSENIVESHFQIYKQQLDQQQFLTDTGFIKQISTSNWSNTKDKDLSATHSKSLIYQGVFAKGVEGQEELKRNECIQFLTVASSGKPSNIRYYVPDSWLSNLDVLLPFLEAQRKMRFTESVIIVSKTVTDALPPTMDVKFMPSESAVLVLEPSINEKDSLFLLRPEISSCLLKDVYSSPNVCLLVQVGRIYPEIGGSLEIEVHDASGAQSSLVLWSNQIPMARLFKKGDFMLVLNPYVDLSEEIVCLQVGSKTVVFLVVPYPEEAGEFGLMEGMQFAAIHKDSGDWYRTFEGLFPLAKTNVAAANGHGNTNTNIEGQEQQRITSLSIPNHETCGISIYGRILKMACSENGRGEQVVGLRLQDEFGFTDITLKGSCCYSARSCEQGEFVFLNNLTSTPQQQTPSHPHSNTHLLVSTNATTIFNICRMIGFASSTSLHRITPLDLAVKESIDFFYCRAFVLQWHVELEMSIHIACNNEVELDDGIAFCPSCLTFVDDVANTKVYSLTLDDGTGQITVKARENVILNLHLSQKESRNLLQQHHFGIVQFEKGNFKASLLCSDPPVEAMVRAINAKQVVSSR